MAVDWDRLEEEALAEWESVLAEQEQLILGRLEDNTGPRSLGEVVTEDELGFVLEGLGPLILGLVRRGADLAVEDGVGSLLPEGDVRRLAFEMFVGVRRFNETTMEDLDEMFEEVMEDDEADRKRVKEALVAGVVGVFAGLVPRLRLASVLSVVGAVNFGAFAAAGLFNDFSGQRVYKTWRSRRDSRVRHTHRILEGQTVPLSSPFVSVGALIRFPGDPLAPLHEVANCRCVLRFSKQ